MYIGDAAREKTVDGVTVKVRDPWRVGILTLVTLGFYGIMWFFMVNRELNDWAKARGVSGASGNPVLATIGYVIPIVNIGVWIWTLQRIRWAQAAATGQTSMSWGSTIVAAIVGIVPLAGVVIWCEHVQHNINVVWQPGMSASGAGERAGGGKPVPALS
jgi:hypothetical protein